MKHSLLFVPICALLCTTAAHAQSWSDNFDSYGAPVSIVNLGGWEEWGPGAGANVVNTQALSAPNSVEIVGATDLVHQYAGVTSGKWVYRTMQYIPSSMTGLTYFILLNTYASPVGPYNWSAQVGFNATLGQVEADCGASNNGIAPLVTDAWVEIKVFIDLDNDWTEFYYNGEQVGPGYTWTGGVFGQGGGVLNLAAVDLYANSATAVYYDDMALYPFEYESFGPGCPGSQGDIEFSVQLQATLTNGVFVTDINNLPSGAAFHMLGLSKSASFAGPLPLDLSTYGAPNCSARVSPDAVLFMLPTPAGSAFTTTFAMSIPNNPMWLGQEIHEQVLALDSGQNQLGAVVSPAMTFQIRQ